MSNPVSTGMNDRHWADVPPGFVTNVTSHPGQLSFLSTVGRKMSTNQRKGKEEYLYSTIYTMHILKALRHGSHSFTCKLNHACLSFVSVHQMAPPPNWGSRHPIAAYYSFIDPEGMKGWVGLVGWPIADSLPKVWCSSAAGVKPGWLIAFMDKLVGGRQNCVIPH